MSLVPLNRITFAGLTTDKGRLLDDLHELGCLELIPLRGQAKQRASGAPSSQSREALKFLLSCPQRRHQLSDIAQFDAAAVERDALDLQQRIRSLESERDGLIQRLADVKPWGDFHFPTLEQLGGYRFWFYAVPHTQMPQVESSGLAWQIAERDQRFCYIVVVSLTEPESMPVPRVHVGARSPVELSRRLEEVESALEDAQADRARLTRWCLLFAGELASLEAADARHQAAHQTCDSGPVFALQAWAPREHVKELAQYAARNGFVFESRPPDSDENPPTLMRNAPRIEAGQDLVNFYMTPGYWTWDPSGVVLVSFAIFFAMILADAGYACVLGVALLVGWRSLGRSGSLRRFRPLLTLIVFASIIYGVLVGSYFGVTPPKHSLLSRLHVLDMTNSKVMMGISVLVGGLHVLLANLMEAQRHSDWRDTLAPLGWAAAVAGGLILGGGAAVPALAMLKPLGGGAIVFGLLLVVGFTAPHDRPLKRFGQGLLGLTKVSAAFGDVLSYLRLFALGLASASLATAFNDMAEGIRTSMPRLGLLLALLILLLGHALNLLLGISSGVIHGLRLNVIEFFNWGLKDEGRPFTHFRRKDGAQWK